MPSIVSLSPRVLASVSVKNIQPPSIYTTNLVVHLDAGKTTSYTGSGTAWTDLSGNSNDFTLKKGQTSSSTTAIGPTYFINNSNYGMQFAPGGTYNTPSTQDGTNAQWLQGPEAILNNYSTGTIEFWLQTLAKTRPLDFRDGDSGSPGVVYSHCLTSRQRNGNYSHAIFSIGAYCNSSGQPIVGTAGKLYWHSNNGITQAASTGTISDATVCHVVVTFSSTNCKFYINGALDSTTSGNYSAPDNGGLVTNYGTTIGVWPAGNYNTHQFAGSIYNVKIYNAQLSDSQVLQNYLAVKGRFGL